MVKLKDFIQFKIGLSDIQETINKVFDNLNISQLDNLRYRSKMVQIDCLFRGYLGELCLKKWFAENGIEISVSNMIDDYSMDIDMEYKDKSIEIKTSNVPDKYENISGVIQYADIKLIRRGSASIEDLKGDIHVQIYYDFFTKVRDQHLNKLDQTITNADDMRIRLCLDEYIDNSYFVAWIDKPSLVGKINSLPVNERTWTFVNSQREFWVCKIGSDAKAPIDIIAYLNSL